MLEQSDRVLGFVENSSDPRGLQAWRGDCENMFLAEGDKTPAFREFNNMQIVCDSCYGLFKARHEFSGAGGHAG